MSEKPRAYRSALRDDQARATRRRVVDAARDLFIEHGYAGATIDAIAERAGVSRKTVFTSIGGKPAALRLAWDWTLAGDDEQVPIADRPVSQQIFESRDPVDAIDGWARLQGPIASRLARIYEVVVIASDSDAEVAGMRATNERNRMAGARQFAEHLASLAALRSGLTVERATEIVGVLMDPVPAGRLVHDAGWSVPEYCEWLARMHRAALLDP
jgi:AcrR family transcriptional regulator